MQPGVRLGPYEIVAPLGAGGMGEVYRARDVRLDRDVAIKILSASLGADAVRRERFEREARIVSSLNHPHICALYDIGRDGDHDFLVLEYLDGEPLDRRLAASRGRPLPLKLALQIAAQIADALDKAHRAGVVHRDLKPQNIFLTKNGAKLLDFGLAKIAGVSAPAAGAVDPAAVPRTARELTIDGTIVGTFLYMAPEQLAGRDADVRTDIYAFGLVLYEMLTGKRPFEDHPDTGVITAVFEREPPPITAVIADLPASVDRIVRTCLAKDPDDRFQSAHDLLLQLRWASEPAADGVAAARLAESARRWRAAAAIAAGAVAAVAAVAAWMFIRASRPSPSVAVTRFSYAMPADQNFTRTGRRLLALSPDGTKFVYIANRQIYLKAIDELQAAPVLGTDEDPSDVSFSSDGAWIVYWSVASRELRKVPVAGGTSVAIARTLNPWGSSWSGDRLFLSEGEGGVLELPANGGAARHVVAARDGEVIYGPELLPDGGTLLFTTKPAATKRWDDATIVAQSIATGARTTIVQGGTDAHYARGQLIYMHDGAILAAPFDTRRLAVTGAAVTVVPGVGQAGAGITGAGFYAFSSTGTLVYVPGDTSQQRTLVLLNREGRETPVAAPPKAYVRARFSPSGDRLAIDVRELDADLWMWDVNREVLTRLTSTRSDERNAIWTPDGRQLVYASDAGGSNGLYRLAADGSGTAERLTTSPDIQAPLALSPDGRVIVLMQLKSGTINYELRSIEVDGNRTPRMLTQAPLIDPYVAISPDGRWMAYASLESGRSEVFVRRFPSGTDTPVRVSTDGGSYPMWPRLGHELLYLDLQRRMMSADVRTGATFSASKARPLFAARYFTPPLGRAFDVTEDGRRFVMIKDSQANRQFVFVEHWLDEVVRQTR